MIPVLYQFRFDSAGMQALLYLIAVALVIYIAVQGWRGAQGEPGAGKDSEPKPPTRQERMQRALMFGGGAIALAFVGLHYALPPTVSLPFYGPSRGEGIPIHTYGILLMLGFVLAVTLAAELARREWRGEEGEIKRDQVMDLAFWVLLGGIGGSRILFIIVNYKDYVANPGNIFSFSGGLVFYGGLIGAAIAAYWFSRKNKIDFVRLADLSLPTVSLGQCLGRLGCFSAGCCWGRVAKPGMPFAVHFPGPLAKNIFGQIGGVPSLAFDSQQRDGQRWLVESTAQLYHEKVANSVNIAQWVNDHGTTLPIHPTQLYESIGQFCLFLALLFARKYRRFHGQIIGMWLMCYAILRTTVELFRGDLERGTLHGLLSDMSPTLANKIPLEAWYNISTSQFISLCMFTAGAIILYRGAKQFFPASGMAQPAAA